MKALRYNSPGTARGEQAVKIAMEGKELKQIDDFLYLESVSGQDSPYDQDILLTKEVQWE